MQQFSANEMKVQKEHNYITIYNTKDYILCVLKLNF